MNERVRDTETQIRTDQEQSSSTEVVPLGDGRVVVIRPILSSDASILVEFHEALSNESARNRFFGSHRHLTAGQARHFVEVDGCRRVFLVALHGGRVVGVARYDPLSDRTSAEAGLLVADDYQRHGIGTRLVQLLAQKARASGWVQLVTQTLDTDFPMIDAFLHSGFPVELHRNGNIVDASMTLTSSLHPEQEQQMRDEDTTTVDQPGDLGRRIRHWRERRGLSRSELAERAGINNGYLDHIESRPSVPSLRTISALAEALGITVAELLGGNVNRLAGRAPSARQPVFSKLTADRCWALLGSSGVGRVVFDLEDGPIALPVNFAVSGHAILLRTEEGSSIDRVSANSPISFQVDQIDEATRSGWSVLVRGECEHLSGHGDATFDVALDPWVAGNRVSWIRLRPSQISGRVIEVSQ